MTKTFTQLKNALLSKATAIVFVLMAFTQWTIAQPTANQKVQMADGLRSSGKIYVVVVVLLTVLAGLFIYVINVDRKISKLEKENQA